LISFFVRSTPIPVELPPKNVRSGYMTVVPEILAAGLKRNPAGLKLLAGFSD
jgi:hypothetical protein